MLAGQVLIRIGLKGRQEGGKRKLNLSVRQGPFPGRGVWGFGSPHKVRGGEALLVKGALHFARSSENLTGHAWLCSELTGISSHSRDERYKVC